MKHAYLFVVCSALVLSVCMSRWSDPRHAAYVPAEPAESAVVVATESPLPAPERPLAAPMHCVLVHYATLPPLRIWSRCMAALSTADLRDVSAHPQGSG